MPLRIPRYVVFHKPHPHLYRMTALTITHGFTEPHRNPALRLFWQALKTKLNPVMGPEPKALAVLSRVADPSHAISATAKDGTLLGIAGFKTDQGAFIGGDWPDLTATYGTLSTLWRAPLLSILEWDLAKNVLLLDGIFVTEAARGQGVSTTPRARPLHEREGFVAGETHNLGPLRHIFGFRHATIMIHTA